ncbi:hypothetical protein H072_11398 [Dactylellina haptotyla CBS 200.50]|uniref:Uncharacterized protein n=1 Tax=Dactylellina haptotyla (strain CBS 200.50) TaxID=1284197 RepID=S8BIZ4_DACHA|nr:hypothetical protein H072_11398 [Dactylellina haptotyla CBS 200.50]
MKFSILFFSSIAIILARSTGAVPIIKKADIDLVVLQFALTLEHLENVFYKKALSTLPEYKFLAAGFTREYYQNLKYIAHDEEAHVKLLTDGITTAGGMPVAACTYDFPITDVKSFIGLSSILEGVGTSAYLGSAPLITSKDYLAVAGSILVAEALHTSMQRQALHRVPSANPYGTPLTPSPVYTLAAAFIKSCPSTNMALPFTAFPALTFNAEKPTLASISISIDIGNKQSSNKPAPVKPLEFSVVETLPSDFFVTFVNGLEVVSIKPTSVSGKTFSATPPDTFGGQTYALVTSVNMTSGPIADSGILFGPAILEITPRSPNYDVNYQ